MKKFNLEDIKNIIKLLEDPDDKVFELLKPQILNNGNEFEEFFLKESATTSNNYVKQRLSIILGKLYLKNIDQKFRLLPSTEKGELDLEAAVFLLAQFNYPELDILFYKKIIDDMAEDLIKKNIKQITDPMIMIETINEYLFIEKGFSGNQIDYMEPDNSYINRVIDRKTGIPISLSTLYLFITKRLNIPLNGIGMPGHFILQYKQDNFELFIDPYYSGQILSRQDCINFLLFSGYGYLEKYLEISTNKEIFKRMIRNLLLIYKEQNDDEKYDKLRDILNIIDINF